MTAQVNKNVSSLIGIELKAEGLEKLKEYSESLATGVRLIEESLEYLNNPEVHLSFGKVTDLKQNEEDEKGQETVAGVIELNPQLIAPQQLFTKGVKGICYPKNVQKTIEEIEASRGNGVDLKRIDKLKKDIIDVCRTGRYSNIEIRSALIQVKTLIEYIPLN
ncbi:hypothetical protein [Turicibacter sanguinis]|uniref:hypothetical protein n=1 Tax=Turicibacter sanguinis TaxID=154288 RepID=UPI00232B10F6|nr:hypothetical protein [Turicibacter sanguinis]MDB8576226.1 hypothetical protein [Turicibacter sanguinis]MDB8579256.1 hypothetical protein [Turicibacter sanguinis]MDB8584946.1 hypothetical protein [Turicibacter sanguinis]MDB8588148.1 hypothetical protein [Turicibacter sanguinis]MDB8599002.1 hypothetical protein [Turicibacter sanguinis]